MKLRILHLEDDPQDAELVRRALARHGLEFDLVNVSSGQKYLEALVREPFDVILSDCGLPGYDWREARSSAKQLQPQVPFILLSGAVESLEPPVLVAAAVAKHKLEELGAVVRRVVQEAEARGA